MAFKHGPKKKGITPEKARHWIGHPVCVVLNDGSYYVGIVEGIDNDELILSGAKGGEKMSGSGRSKGPAQVSGLLQSIFGGGQAFNPPAGSPAGAFNPFAAGAAGGRQPVAGPGPGGGGFFGMVRQMWPTISFGLQMVRTIMPLMGAFKI